MKLKLIELMRPRVDGKRTYMIDDATGEPPVPGDCYWQPREHNSSHSNGMCYYWDDCNDPRGHLYIVLPNGSHWSPSERASNCDMRSDRLHRCWVMHGEPPNITVDKAGVTCAAGAGSIASDGWHGFVRAGALVVA